MRKKKEKRSNATDGDGVREQKPLSVAKRDSTISLRRESAALLLFLEAWDSPFDFMWKMNEQLKAVKRHFTNKINEGATEAAKKVLEAATAEFPSGIGTGTIATPGSGAQTNKAMKDRTETTAAHNEWKYYWKEPVEGIRAYIPGLGLRLNAGLNTGSNAEANTVPGTHINFVNKASAGTDCIGLVQRAATYRGNSYVWADVNNRDRAENAGNANHNIDSQARNTRYPHKDSYSITIVNRAGIGGTNNIFQLAIGSEGNTMTAQTFASIKEQFSSVVPGDIIRYSDEHIGIIHGINGAGIENASSVYDLMRSVQVIETTVWGLLSYACTRNMIAGDGANFDENLPGSWHRSTYDTLRDWYIERLK